MPDNVTLPATGSGSATPVIASDDVGGAQHQRVKISVGADGAATDATPATPVPVSSAPSASSGAPAAFTATVSTTIFASTPAAKLRTFANDSDKDLYLLFRAAAVSLTSYTVKVAAGDFSATDYTGEIRGILSAAIVTGRVNICEFT